MNHKEHFPLPQKETASKRFVRFFSPLKHPRTLSRGERVLFGILVALVCLSGYLIVRDGYRATLIEVPARGGSYTEGIVGTPRFINPVLASSQADRDLTALVYSGLMHMDSNGALLPALALSYTISPDNLVYHFTLREDAVFHDGSPVTADDVVFTLSRIQDPRTKSPLFVNWEGVHVEKIDDRTIRITLPTPYAPFLYNASVGILPKKLWEQVEPEEMPFSTLNALPVGTGPFKVEKVTRDGSGMPTQYALARFDAYLPVPPFLDAITIHIFNTEDELAKALTAGSVEAGGGIKPTSLLNMPKGLYIAHTTLPRIFAIFYNQNTNTVFADTSVRAALDRVLPKEELVAHALFGYGIPLKGPILPQAHHSLAQATSSETAYATSTAEKRLSDAREIMEIGGWEKGEDGVWIKKTKKENLRLAFTLSTSEAPELAYSAEDIARLWREFGAEVTVTLFEPTMLAKEIIRPRKYDALFFGLVVGHGLDLYPFWHSSQRNDPGLNVALYTNITADKALETLRTSSDTEKRDEALRVFLREIKIDAPAAFVFAPDYIYVLPERLKQVSLVGMENAEDRFQHVATWYIETDHVWPFVEEWFGRE